MTEQEKKVREFLEKHGIPNMPSQLESEFQNGVSNTAQAVMQYASQQGGEIDGLTKEEEKERAILLEVQKDWRRWFSQEEFDRLQELNTKSFKQLNTPQWTAVEDGLPEEGGVIMICNDKIGVGYYNYEEESWSFEGIFVEGVTHWRYIKDLPLPPKPENK